MKPLNKIAEEGNKNFTILIAEDNKLQSQIHEELITPSGYKFKKPSMEKRPWRKLLETFMK